MKNPKICAVKKVVIHARPRKNAVTLAVVVMDVQDTKANQRAALKADLKNAVSLKANQKAVAVVVMRDHQAAVVKVQNVVNAPNWAFVDAVQNRVDHQDHKVQDQALPNVVAAHRALAAVVAPDVVVVARLN